MKRERSAGIIVFRRIGGKISYLLLHYATKSSHWDFPKGHVEKGETPRKAALREVKEETGIKDLQLLDGFEAEIAYYYQKDAQQFFKEVVFFLGETKTEQVKLSKEHVGFRWAAYSTAMKQLTYDKARMELQKADAFLKL